MKYNGFIIVLLIAVFGMTACQTISSKQARKGWKKVDGWADLQAKATEEKKTGEEKERLPAASSGPFICTEVKGDNTPFDSMEEGLNYFCNPHSPFQILDVIDNRSSGLIVCCHKNRDLNREQYQKW